MRFLLVNPYYSIDETPSPPLGLSLLAAVLENHGVEVKIVDFVVFPYSKEFLAKEIESFSPDIVGLTAVTMTFDNGIDIVKKTKEIDSSILTVMGGPHVSFRAPQTLNEYPELDFIVKGEGEEIILDLINRISAKESLDSIEGVYFRKNSEIIFNDKESYSIDIDALPVPARKYIPLGRYRALNMPVSMTTSRGCPFPCIFCVGRKMVGAKVRYRDPVKVADEFEYLASLNFNQINIADDLFTANKKHCIAVCDEIIKRKIKMTWSSFARVDTVSLEVLKKMKEAGCGSVSFGVETANVEILKTIRKGITLDQVYKAIEMCNEAEITPHASFILGLPGETPETLEETTLFGEKIKKSGCSYGFHLLAPFPGTAIRDNHEQYGLKVLTSNWSKYHANRAIVETDTVDKDMLDKIAIHWESQVTEWLEKIKKGRTDGNAIPEELQQLENLEKTVILYDLMMKTAFEDFGNWPSEGQKFSEEIALKEFAGKVCHLTDYDSDIVYEALYQTKEKGNIRVFEEDDSVKIELIEDD